MRKLFLLIVLAIIIVTRSVLVSPLEGTKSYGPLAGNALHQNGVDLAIQSPVPPTPTPTPTPTPKPLPINAPTSIQNRSNSICINYGHNTNDYDLSSGGMVDKDLKNIRESGINCIRLAYEHWNYSWMLELANFAKTNGFRVILGGYYGEVGSSDLEPYKSEVLQQAQWAAEHSIDQFSLGNEQETKLVELTDDDWYNFLIGLAAEVRDIYPGMISYESSGETFESWVTRSTLGEIDRIGFNMYSGYNTNKNRIERFIQAHGKDRVYISETNADKEIGQFDDDTDHAEWVKENTLPLLNLGIPIYFFTYHTCVGTEIYWGLYQCGELAQPETAAVLGIE